jgi:hypothetical protein
MVGYLPHPQHGTVWRRTPRILNRQIFQRDGVDLGPLWLPRSAGGDQIRATLLSTPAQIYSNREPPDVH